MEIIGFEVEAQAPTPADRDADLGRWYVDRFGVVPHLSALVADLDAAVAELTAAGVPAVPLDLSDEDEDARAVRITGPAGATVDVVQPAPAGAYEERIGGFIESAADLEGPPTEDLGEAVLAVVRGAWDAIDRVLADVPHNKVLATMLLVGQQARQEQPDAPGFWQRSAASTLLSGFVGRNARDARDEG